MEVEDINERLCSYGAIITTNINREELESKYLDAKKRGFSLKRWTPTELNNWLASNNKVIPDELSKLKINLKEQGFSQQGNPQLKYLQDIQKKLQSAKAKGFVKDRFNKRDIEDYLSNYDRKNEIPDVIEATLLNDISIYTNKVLTQSLVIDAVAEIKFVLEGLTIISSFNDLAFSPFATAFIDLHNSWHSSKDRIVGLPYGKFLVDAHPYKLVISKPVMKSSLTPTSACLLNTWQFPPWILLLINSNVLSSGI